MSVAESPKQQDTYIPVDDRPEMSAEAFLALPEDGKDRELVHGRLWERAMTYRNRFHSGCEAALAKLLGIWLDQQPSPRGKIVSGEAGFQLPGARSSIVGIDVAVVSAELLASTKPSQLLFHGAPVLAVEILSGSESVEEIEKKVAAYLEVGTITWVVNPFSRTVIVYRPGARSVLFNEGQILDADPYLPGFHVAVAELFEM